MSVPIRVKMDVVAQSQPVSMRVINNNAPVNMETPNPVIKVPGSSLPDVTSADDGKVLSVDNGEWTAGGVLIETTYANLKALRDAGNLVPGMAYRITDYVTIINGKYDLSAVGASGYLHYAVSAGHPFDIIVMAVGESELSEVARAAHHDGDTYFANAAVDAWEIKYTLDNDPLKFSWADSTNGKGVIFYMKDEWGNECGYDFKNIMFPRYALKLADATEDYTPVDTGLVYNAETQPNRYGSLYQIFTALSSYLESGTYVNPWVQKWNGQDVNNYDFACGANILNVIQYAEINDSYKTTFGCDLYYTFDFLVGSTHFDASQNVTGFPRCYNNIIEETPDGLYAQLEGLYIPIGLNGTVFEHLTENSQQPYGNNNYIASGSILNTFGSGASRNRVGDSCYGNTFGNDCYYNTFYDNCYNNTFGNGCYSNTFGENFDYNTFGYDCRYNTFGVNCHHNTLQGHISNSTLGRGNDYLEISGGSIGGSVSYYHICDRVKGTNSTPLFIVGTPSLSYETWVGYNSSGVLKTWCPADLA